MKRPIQHEVTVKSERDGRTLTARVVLAGGDVVVVVTGGDRPHVGCVVLAAPTAGRGTTGFSPTVSVLTIPPHKEEPIARGVAEAVCSELGRVVIVTAGVHEDGIEREGIETYLRLGGELAAAVVDRLRSSG